MTNEIIIYQTEDGQTQIDVRMENETVWLSASQMASLFDREESNIRRHIINVFNEGELERTNNVQNLHVNGVKKSILVGKTCGLLTGYRNRRYRLTKLKNLLTQKLTFRLLLAFF